MCSHDSWRQIERCSITSFVLQGSPYVLWFINKNSIVWASHFHPINPNHPVFLACEGHYSIDPWCDKHPCVLVSAERTMLNFDITSSVEKSAQVVPMTTARWSWRSLENHVLSLLQAAEGQIPLSSSCLSQTFNHPHLEGRGNGSASLHTILHICWLKAVSESGAWQRQRGLLVGLDLLGKQAERCYLAFIPVSKQHVQLCLPSQVSVSPITKRTSQV